MIRQIANLTTFVSVTYVSRAERYGSSLITRNTLSKDNKENVNFA